MQPVTNITLSYHGDSVPVAKSRADFYAMQDAAVHDKDAFGKLLETGRGAIVPAGTRATMAGDQTSYDCIEVRFLDGPLAGETGYVTRLSVSPPLPD